MTSRPRTKYDEPEHRHARKAYAEQMKRDGFLICVEPICLHDTRLIQPGDKWHVCHDPSGLVITGPGHQLCNITEGGKRAYSKQRKRETWAL